MDDVAVKAERMRRERGTEDERVRHERDTDGRRVRRERGADDERVRRERVTIERMRRDLVTEDGLPPVLTPCEAYRELHDGIRNEEEPTAAQRALLDISYGCAKGPCSIVCLRTLICACPLEGCPAATFLDLRHACMPDVEHERATWQSEHLPCNWHA